jgi:hypothetical protein
LKKGIIFLLWLVGVSFAAVFLVAGVNAQDATGRIVGNVTDPSGASVAGAKITVQNANTGSIEEAESDKDGFYQILSLPIGTYTVTVESTGFRKQVFERQTLQINQSLRLDAKLAIGQTSETVEVTDQVANIETINQTVGATVTGPAIQQAPLNGRNVLDLAKLR